MKDHLAVLIETAEDVLGYDGGYLSAKDRDEIVKAVEAARIMWGGSKKKVYVSGPITYATGPDRFAPLKARLEALGYEVLNPKDVPACASGDCPKLPHEVERGWEHSWACYLKHDLAAMLASCDAILMMDGWQDSHGARAEMSNAALTGMRIMFEHETDPERTFIRSMVALYEHLTRTGQSPAGAWDVLTNLVDNEIVGRVRHDEEKV